MHMLMRPLKTGVIVALFFTILTGCSDNDSDGFPRNADIEMIVESSDHQRLTEIETIVFGTGLELRTHSYSNTHLPYKKFYLNQQIPRLSYVSMSFRDNSVVTIGATFTSYASARKRLRRTVDKSMPGRRRK